MKALLFPGDQQFWYEMLRALGHTAYGGADIGEVVTTAQRITAGDYGSWYAQWAATAQRTEAEARAQLAAGHQVSARDGLLRAATYWRSAEFFTRDADPDPRGRPAYAAYLVQTKAPRARGSRSRSFTTPTADRPCWPTTTCATATRSGSASTSGPWPTPRSWTRRAPSAPTCSGSCGRRRSRLTSRSPVTSTTWRPPWSLPSLTRKPPGSRPNPGITNMERSGRSAG